jgi:hypothetical protein
VIAGLVLAVALGPAMTPRAARAVDGAEPDRTISVSGTGTVTLAPDVADLHVGVVIQRPKVKDAQAAAAAAMQGVVKALRAAGVAERDIQTTAPAPAGITFRRRRAATGAMSSNGVVATVRSRTARRRGGRTPRRRYARRWDRSCRYRAAGVGTGPGDADAREGQYASLPRRRWIVGVASIAGSGQHRVPVLYAADRAAAVRRRSRRDLTSRSALSVVT